MDWKRFADHFSSMTCVLSVEKKPDGGYGKIRIVTGNEAYLDSLALAAGGLDLGSTEKKEFIPNSEYERYIPKDLNFEDACYQCAILKKPIHNYVRAIRYSFDINLFMLPLESEEDDELAYCTFSQVLLSETDSSQLSLNVSRESAADVIATCIKLRGDKDFKVTMQEVIEDIRKICRADSCHVLLVDESRRQCSVLCESKAPSSPLASMKIYLDDDFYDLAETWKDTIGGSYCLVLQNEKDMEYLKERNPRWYQSLTGAGIDHLVIFPLQSRGHLLGYIWATNFDTADTLRIKATLELTSYFIASEIASYKFVERLTVVSKTDLLTGVMNRNEMNNRVTALSEKGGEEPCRQGIVFADMNGLKYVNDTQGHLAGDQLLKNAAMILQSTFLGEEIYRVGGDEFMVLLHDTSPEDMQEKIEEIKKKSDMFENVSFSAGWSYMVCSRDIRKSLAEADARMYEDKENYYRQHPEFKRK